MLKSRSGRFLLAALASVAGFAATAHASTTSATFDITVTIQKTCSVTAGAGSAIDLGTIASTATNTTGNGVAGTGTGSTQSFVAYASVASANYTPDTYSDTVTVNVNY